MERRKLLIRAVVLVLFAAIFGIVQLDQAARSNGRLALLLPAGLGGYADSQLAAAQFARDPQSAEDAVVSLLRHRPIEARHLSLYSVVAAEADDMESAGKALNYAATRGWRDPYVQVAVLGSAVAASEPEIAAARLEALARTERSPAIIHQAIDIMASNPAGRVAIASRMGDSAYLTDQLVDYAEARPGQENIPLELFALSGGGEGLTCERRSRLAETMLKRGLGEARLLLSENCPEMREPGLAFEPYSDARGPLDWVFPNSAGISVREGVMEGTLTFNNRNLLEKVVAYRYLLLEPGTHRFSAVEHDSSQRPLTGGSNGAIEVRITCPEGPERARRLVMVQDGYGGSTFTVPEDCPVQQIRIFASRGRGENVCLALN